MIERNFDTKEEINTSSVSKEFLLVTEWEIELYLIIFETWTKRTSRTLFIFEIEQVNGSKNWMYLCKRNFLGD